MNNRKLDIMMIGQRLKSYRLYKGYSLRHVSELTGISHVGIRNYEEGKRCIDLDRLFDICNAYGIDMVKFLDECMEYKK